MKLREMNTTAYSAAQMLFLLGVFLKQFYLFSSGGFQLGDFCFMGSFLIVLMFVLRFKLPLGESDGLILGFVGCVVLINIIYIGIYGNDYPGEFRFHLSIVYYVYNLFIILTFRQFCSDVEFLKRVRLCFQAALLFQLFVAFAGLGRFGSMRYTGTFNDPNQCGFYVLASFLMIFIISNINKEGHLLLWFVIAFYLIMRTVSTGMMLGLGVLMIAYIFLKISEINEKSATVFLVISIGILLLFILYGTGILSIPSSISSTTMYRRIILKFWSFGVGTNGVRTGGLRNLFIDRCWDRLLDYPWKILYGAGEGYHNRFPSARYTNNEIHSSILGPLFYYGIIPCSIWFTWTIKQLKDIKRELWVAYIALMIESITLVNNRQPFFWMIFVIAGSCLAKKSYQIEEPKE